MSSYEQYFLKSFGVVFKVLVFQLPYFPFTNRWTVPREKSDYISGPEYYEGIQEKCSC